MEVDQRDIWVQGYFGTCTPGDIVYRWFSLGFLASGDVSLLERHGHVSWCCRWPGSPCFVCAEVYQADIVKNQPKGSCSSWCWTEQENAHVPRADVPPKSSIDLWNTTMPHKFHI